MQEMKTQQEKIEAIPEEIDLLKSQIKRISDYT